MTKVKTVKKEVKLSNFQKKVLQRLEGDTNESLVGKIERLTISIIEAQIAALRGSIVRKELAVVSATEMATDAQYPTSIKKLDDETQFIENIVNTLKKVSNAEKDLENTQELIVTLEGILENYK